MNLTKFQVIKIGTIIILSFASLNGNCAELVKSNCDWKPPPPNSLQNLQSNKLIEISETKTDRQKSEDNDFFKVEQKGRLHFHALPDEKCKTDIFIVKGDTVEVIDMYPEKSPNFARVIFFSKSMKKEIVGWVKIESIRRMTYSETRAD